MGTVVKAKRYGALYSDGGGGGGLGERFEPVNYFNIKRKFKRDILH